MIVIGVTGSFGTGKTFVASILKSLGARVIDADAIAHDIIKKRKPAYRKIIAAFGSHITNEDREIDRKALGLTVFRDAHALSKLNRIVHPEVIKVIKAKIKTFGRDAVVVIDAPLLVEACLLNMIDRLVVVKCSRERQISRCVRKFRMKRQEVLRRIRSQVSMKRKLEIADFIVQNDGARSSTRDQVKRIWKEIVWI